ncbi:hypothetical protein ABFT51_27920 (plasmid) [Paenibacillus peoriae]|uniref:hypothetical protein n=1 Tax=Paenibacillus peoriae TaxID=59893 RepID=UPI0032AFD360
MGDKVRVEVTFNTDKHADILAAMKKFGSQAGFLKFAAVHYLNTTGGNNNNVILPPSPEISKTPAEHSASQPPQESRRRLPSGIGGQAISTRLE